MNWIDLLRQAIEKDGKTRVAKDLGISRTTIHMVLKGTYNADTKNIERKVLSSYGKTLCPFLKRILDAAECRWFRERPVPMSHHTQIEHWQACQDCDAPIVPDTPDPESE